MICRASISCLTSSPTLKMEACHTPWLDSCDEREARAGGREGEMGGGRKGGRKGGREEWFTNTRVGDHMCLDRRVT